MRTSSHEAITDMDWDKMKSLLKNCTAVEMSHPDHNLHRANPEEFCGYIDEFIED